MNIDKITPTPSVALADEARKLELSGKSVIKLQTGDPDFNTHPNIIKAAEAAIAQGLTHYSFSRGLPELRTAIADMINRETASVLDENNVLVTCGAVQGMQSIFSAILEAGDEVIILEPNWPTVDSLVIVNGGNPVKINFFVEENIIGALDNAYTNKSKAIVINFPNNPTGAILSKETIASIVNWAISKDLYVVADEVYRFFQYGTYVTTIELVKHYAKYIFLDSFSKKFAMTGWRVGYVVSSRDVITSIAKASQLAITHIPPFIQKAAVAALQDEDSLRYCEMMKGVYDDRRKQLLKYCVDNGIPYIDPAGAFYLFLKLPDNINDRDFCKSLLELSLVCVVPGISFGLAGKGYIRISYANDFKQVQEGLERIREKIHE